MCTGNNPHERVGRIQTTRRQAVKGVAIGALASSAATRTGVAQSSEQTFEILSTTDDSEVGYRFTVDGDASKAVADGHAADSDDAVRDDGATATGIGSTGDASGDVYTVTGDITDFERTSGTSGVRLELDDEDVTNELVAPEDRVVLFEVLSTTDDTEVGYRFTVAGFAAKGESETNAADDDDDVTSVGETATVVGSTGDASGDVFRVAGEITNFERLSGDSGLRLVLDGRDVTDELLDSSTGPGVDPEAEAEEISNRVETIESRSVDGHDALLADYRREGIESLSEGVSEISSQSLADTLATRVRDADELNEEFASAVVDSSSSNVGELREEATAALQAVLDELEQSRGTLSSTLYDGMVPVTENLVRAERTGLIGRAATALESTPTSTEWFESIESEIDEIQRRYQRLRDQGYELRLDVETPAVEIVDPTANKGAGAMPVVTGSALIGGGMLMTGLLKATALAATTAALVKASTLTAGYVAPRVLGIYNGPSSLLQNYFPPALFRQLYFTRNSSPDPCPPVETLDTILTAVDIDDRFQFISDVATVCDPTPGPEDVAEALGNDIEEFVGDEPTLTMSRMCASLANEDHVRGFDHEHSHQCMGERYSFSVSEHERAYLRVRIENYEQADFRYVWVGPSGPVFENSGTVPYRTGETDQIFLWNHIELSSDLETGTWNVDFYYDGEFMSTEVFTVTG